MLAFIETAVRSLSADANPASHGSFPITVLIFFSVLFIYVIAGSAFQHFELHYLHESGLAIMLGGIVGFGYFVYNQVSGSQTVNPMSFDEQYFFYFLLPPMIFSSGYNLRTRKFFTYIPYTLLFGIVGTLLNFVTTVGLTYLAHKVNAIWIIDPDKVIKKDVYFRDILLFSSTICASNSGAAVALIKYKEYPKLYSVVFGEGLVNDAVSIILYQAVAEIVAGVTELSWTTPFRVIGNFLSLASLSTVLGLVIGIFSAIFMRKAIFLVENPSAQFLTVFGFGYFAYIVSEICHLSGIITLLIIGIVMSHYTFYNLSQSAQISTGSTFNGISLLAEGCIFMYLGLSAFFYTSDDWSITLILIEIFITLIARFVGIFVLSWLARAFRCLPKWKLSNRELAVVWFAGLVRGAIALGLILKAPVDPLLRSTVFALVLITTVVLGALIPTFIRKMVHSSGDQGESLELRSRKKTQQDTLEMLQDQIFKFKNKEYRNRLHFYWRVFDDTFMKPWLIRDFDPETQKLNKKLKYDEFGPGRLDLKQQFICNKIKEPAHDGPLTEPLLHKNSEIDDEGRHSGRSGNEHRLIVENRGLISADPLKDSLIISSNTISHQSTRKYNRSHENQEMELGTAFGSKAEEEKQE